MANHVFKREGDLFRMCAAETFEAGPLIAGPHDMDELDSFEQTVIDKGQKGGLVSDPSQYDYAENCWVHKGSVVRDTSLEGPVLIGGNSIITNCETIAEGTFWGAKIESGFDYLTMHIPLWSADDFPWIKEDLPHSLTMFRTIKDRVGFVWDGYSYMNRFVMEDWDAFQKHYDAQMALTENDQQDAEWYKLEERRAFRVLTALRDSYFGVERARFVGEPKPDDVPKSKYKDGYVLLPTYK